MRRPPSSSWNGPSIRACIVPPAALSADCQRPTSIVRPCSNEDKERTQDEKGPQRQLGPIKFPSTRRRVACLRPAAAAGISPRVGGIALVVIIQTTAGAATSLKEGNPMRDNPVVT